MGNGRVNRRAFTKASVAAGAAAVALGRLGAETPAAKSPAPGAATPAGERSYGAGPQGWQAGTTIPGEYYVDPRHYENDERLLAERFWLLVDHQSRIPRPGDFFVFEYGRGENVIIVRNDSGGISAFHNVCRHRGSRLCRDDDDPRPGDTRLSVRQQGASGNTPLFRCPYHAWTYDLQGRLVQTYGMPKDFDASKYGLIPVHLKVIQGHIFVNLSRKPEPPDFKEDGDYLETFGAQYGFADLKIAARRFYPIKANWKLAIENFLECYHCGPSHKSLVTTHNWDHTLSPEQQARRNREIAAWEGIDTTKRAAGQKGMGMGGSTNPEDLIGELNPGFVTGSLDGKPVAPLLPAIKDWSHHTRITSTSWSTGYWQAYDDHVMVARFTPRDVALTDCEMFWLVHPGAIEGKDYRPENVMALWDITIREDIWIVENNHLGVMSRAYGPGRYATHEDYPAEFIKWYMTEVAKA